eukprot:TRINITY_DN3592_c0_g2_i2.p1 TRINITY_DN3592_c0_g2~~TRINITY_DN3592_c0_g2_i2.p1  ORF type:complete len:600 (-),score=71.94 TRINITY_DN3592_c0_g2_i2:263-2062(-)
MVRGAQLGNLHLGSPLAACLEVLLLCLVTLLLHTGGGNSAHSGVLGLESGLGEVPFAAWVVNTGPIAQPAGSHVLQSYAIGVDPGTGLWLMVGGRTNGLHGFNPNDSFPWDYANKDLIVADPVKRLWYNVSVMSLNIDADVQDTLVATNAQSYQRDDILYLAGGYGYSRTAKTFVTFPYLVAFNVPACVRYVLSRSRSNNHNYHHNNDGSGGGGGEGDDIRSCVMWKKDSRMAVAGGGMERLGDFLVMPLGAYYRNLYQDKNFVEEYQQDIRMFNVTITPDSTLSINGFTQVSATSDEERTQWHRRDLHVLPTFTGTNDGALSIAMYGGVFTPKDEQPYLNPIFINQPIAARPVINVTVTTDTAYAQMFNQYECGSVVTYDNTTRTMYTTFFGGMSLYYMNGSVPTPDPMVPFVDIISTLVREESGKMYEAVHSNKMPGFMGSSTAFIPLPKLPMYKNGVIDVNAIGSYKEGKAVHIGWIYGGITGVAPNDGPSYASDLLLAVYHSIQSISAIESDGLSLSSVLSTELSTGVSLAPSSASPPSFLFCDFCSASASHIAVWFLSNASSNGVRLRKFCASGLAPAPSSTLTVAKWPLSAAQ